VGIGVWFTCVGGGDWSLRRLCNARDLDRRGDVRPSYDSELPTCDTSQVELLVAEPHRIAYSSDGGFTWSHAPVPSGMEPYAVLLSVVRGEEYWALFDHGVGGWRVARYMRAEEGKRPVLAMTPALPTGGPLGVCCSPEKWSVRSQADYPTNPTQPSSKGPAFDYVQYPFVTATSGQLLTAALWSREWGGGFCNVTIRYLVIDPVTLNVVSEIAEVERQCSNLLDSFPALTPRGAVDISAETLGSLVRARATIYPPSGETIVLRSPWVETPGTPLAFSGRVSWPGWGVRYYPVSSFCAWSPWTSSSGRYVAQPIRVEITNGEEVIRQLWGTVLVDTETPSIQWRPTEFGPEGPDENNPFWYPVGVSDDGEIYATTLPHRASSWAYVVANLNNTIKREGIRYSDLPHSTAPLYSTMISWCNRLYNLIWVIDTEGNPVTPLYLRWEWLGPDCELITSGLADAAPGIRTSTTWKLYDIGGTSGYNCATHRVWYREAGEHGTPMYITFATWNDPIRYVPGHEDDGWFAVHGWCPESESGKCPETSEWPYLTDVQWTIYAERLVSEARASEYLQRARLYQSVGADYVFLVLDCELQNAVYRAKWDCSEIHEVWYSEEQYLSFCPDYYRGRRLYLGDSGHPLMYSDDLGDHWVEFPGWPEGWTISCMLSIPEGVLVFTYGERTYLIQDGTTVIEWGATPSAVVDDASYDPTEPNRILACAGRRLYLSVDSGRTWREVTSPAERGEEIRRTHMLSRLGWLWYR
jgi:hypothetical protein